MGDAVYNFNVNENVLMAIGVTTFLSVLFISPNGMCVLNGVLLCLILIGLLIVINSPDLKNQLDQTLNKIILSIKIYLKRIFNKEEYYSQASSQQYTSLLEKEIHKNQ